MICMNSSWPYILLMLDFLGIDFNYFGYFSFFPTGYSMLSEFVNLQILGTVRFSKSGSSLKGIAACNFSWWRFLIGKRSVPSQWQTFSNVDFSVLCHFQWPWCCQRTFPPPWEFCHSPADKASDNFTFFCERRCVSTLVLEQGLNYW